MIRLYSTIFVLAGVLSFPLSAYADNSETVTTTNVPVETQSTTTTRSSRNPVLIRDSYGNSAILEPAGSSSTVDTVTRGGEVNERTIVNKKSSPHHLINFWGLKVL